MLPGIASAKQKNYEEVAADVHAKGLQMKLLF
jgi:hypothetical protein